MKWLKKIWLKLKLHYEYKKRLREIKKRVELGEDIIGREDNFTKIELDHSFPDYLLTNKEKYSEWIQL